MTERVERPTAAEDAADRPPPSAAEIVARVWATQPPVAHDAFGDAPDAYVVALRAALADVAAQAARAALAVGGADAARDDRRAARLLAETAQAIDDALGASLTRAGTVGRTAAARADAVTPWVDRLRFARMERWLAARAESDHAAEPAASLCLWVIEHLEMAVPLPPQRDAR